jgi:hypothetical protein
MQSVTLLGPVKRHVSQSSLIKSKNLKQHNIIKINVNGLKQRRILMIDAESSSMLNMTMTLELKKQLPLKQLIQVVHWATAAWGSVHRCVVGGQ